MKKIVIAVLSLAISQAFANPSSWIEQNKLVGEIGGWRVYSKEQVLRESPANQNIFTLKTFRRFRKIFLHGLLIVILVNYFNLQ